MTDANGLPLRVRDEVTTGDDPAPLTVVELGPEMLRVAFVEGDRVRLRWLNWSDVERVEPAKGARQ